MDPEKRCIKCGGIIEPGYRAFCENCTADLWANQDKNPYNQEITGPNIPIVDLEIDARTLSILENAGIDTITDITRRTDQDLLSIKGIGPFLVLKIRKAVGSLKISLIPDEDEEIVESI
jgi:DNA-directed RNA polymerase alpha subunit